MKPNYIESGFNAIDIEIRALASLKANLDTQTFTEVCDMIRHCEGKVIVTGMGKSGHIGNKIAATLASTGTPSFFMHPAEANHGDLGMIEGKDILIAISNSGEADEIIGFLPFLGRKGTKVITITNRLDSTLAKHSHKALGLSVETEACPLGLAPTASTTATLALGDAIAVALLEAKGFTSEDFAMSHPAGSLGKKLLLTVKDVMVPLGDEHCNATYMVPLVHKHFTLSEAITEISTKGLGMAGVWRNPNVLKIEGIITDGDIRRCLENQVDIRDVTVDEVYTSDAVTCTPDTLVSEVLHTMETKNISCMMVLDKDGFAEGAINMNLLLRAGVV